MPSGLPILFLAQMLRDPFESITDEDFWEILIGFGWLFAAVFVLLICALVAKRWLKGSSFDTSYFDGRSQFSISDLRQLHKDGLMTDEEFDRAKQMLASRGRSVLNDDESA